MDLTLSDNRAKIAALGETFGTPCYIYDEETLTSCVKTLRAGIGKKPAILYSVKANPNPALLKLWGELVDGMEVCSLGEYRFARKAGISPDRLFFVGPGKRRFELDEILKDDIAGVIAESASELACLQEVAASLKKVIFVELRINPAVSVSGGRLNMSGTPTQFGFSEEEVLELFGRDSACYPNLRLEGAHFYFGTQQLNGDVLNKLFMTSVEIVRKIRLLRTKKNLPPLTVVDFGGGFGVPYYEGETALDFSAIAEWKDVISSDEFSNVKVFVESGRFLSASCGLFLTRILYKKSLRDKTFLIVDGGMNNHFALASIGRLLKRDFPVTPLVQGAATPGDADRALRTEKVTIAGPLCTPVDTLATGAELPEMKEGDLIALANAGAYGYTYSPQLFLSHPAPAELLLRTNGTTDIIREGGYLQIDAYHNKNQGESHYGSK